MSKTIVLTGVGRDKVGIVARMTEILFDLGCNLLDSSMTLLRGEFAVILMVTVPDGVSMDQVTNRLNLVQKELGFTLHVRELSSEETQVGSADDENLFIISVYGADKPGIVSGITRTLADVKANITDVETKRTGGARDKHDPVFLMVLEVSAPTAVSRAELEQVMKTAGTRLGVDVSVSELDCVEL